MPVFDCGFVHAPAQVDFIAAIQAGEIDQACVQIFHQYTGFFNAFHRPLQGACAGLTLCLPAFHGVDVYGKAAAHHDSLRKILYIALCCRVAGLRLHRFTKVPAHGGEHGAGLVQGEVAGHQAVTGSGWPTAA